MRSAPNEPAWRVGPPRPGFVQRELEELGHVPQAEERAEWCRHRVALGILDQPRLREPQHATPRFQRAAPRGQDILDPLCLGSIGEGDDVAAVAPEHVHGRAVLPLGLATGVDDDAEARQVGAKRRVR